MFAPPFPGSYPTPSSGELRALAFMGLHPSLYDATITTVRAFAVSLRFWIARAHTLLQLGANDVEDQARGRAGVDMSLWPAVVACERVVEGVYVVTTRVERTAGGGEVVDEVKYLVLAETGDVIADSRVRAAKASRWAAAGGGGADGGGASDDAESALPVHGCSVRADWHAFITARQMQESSSSSSPCSSIAPTPLPPLATLIKTKDFPSFPGGISGSWSSRATSDAREVATRAVLSSCVLNRYAKQCLQRLTRPQHFRRQARRAADGRSLARQCVGPRCLGLQRAHTGEGRAIPS